MEKHKKIRNHEISSISLRKFMDSQKWQYLFLKDWDDEDKNFLFESPTGIEIIENYTGYITEHDEGFQQAKDQISSEEKL